MNYSSLNVNAICIVLFTLALESSMNLNNYLKTNQLIFWLLQVLASSKL